MSDSQKLFYEQKFDFLKRHKNSEVLSSTFSERETLFMRSLQSLNTKKTNEYVILNSDFAIKNTAGCVSVAKENKLSYKLVSGLPRHELLRLLSDSEGLVFLPIGKDTCPRLVIEAKLLGCKLLLNKNVQHTSEDWFLKTPDEMFDYLDSRKEYFWNKAENVLNE